MGAHTSVLGAGDLPCGVDPGLRRPKNPQQAANVNRKRPSIEALFDFYVYAEGAVLVAQGDHRDVAVYVVFDLNDLLLGGANVADVGDGDLAGALFFDGDAG